MSSRQRPSRQALVPAAFFATLTGVILFFWWSEGANERHVDDLLEMAYDYTELGGPQPVKLGHNENFPSDRTCGDLDNYYGGKTARKAVDDTDDILAVSEDTALRFEREGWTVERLIAESTLGTRRHIMIAERGNDRVEINYFEPNGISILAQSGPCIPAGAGSGVFPDTTPVDRFP